VNFGRLQPLLTSSNTLAWPSTKPEAPPPKGIETPGLIYCDTQIYRPPRESLITCMMSMTPPITAIRVGGMRRRGTVYGRNYHIWIAPNHISFL